MKKKPSARRADQRAAKHARSKRFFGYAVLVIVVVIAIVALGTLRRGRAGEGAQNEKGGNKQQPPQTVSPARKAEFEIVAAYPHDPAAYTQGLVWKDGGFYESTGLYGESTLRRVEFPSGKVTKSISLSPDIFAEGLALVDNRLIQLTWKGGRGFVYDRDTFKLLREFRYDTEGWGLTYDGKNLILSDGSSTLTFLDPENFSVVRRLPVTMNGAPVQNLNELEFINGEIWSNVWLSDVILRIHPASGRVTSYLDMKGLFPAEMRKNSDDVLNGIAYDSDARRLFVGGKRWPQIFEIKLKDEPAH
ncbi:MAG TPA: glutaminyl-peptide cyclotransferase [Blastocatellia bacterium]|nr:glutaminyl-peptide cyclotransferase [Blastocatellia bacterium]